MLNNEKLGFDAVRCFTGVHSLSSHPSFVPPPLTGGLPYANFTNRELVSQLKQGYRMECPDSCSEEM